MSEMRLNRRAWMASASGTVLMILGGCRPSRGPGGRGRSLQFERVAVLGPRLGQPVQLLAHGSRALVVAETGFAVVGDGVHYEHQEEDAVRRIAIPVEGGFLLGTERFAWDGTMRDRPLVTGMLDTDGRRQIALSAVGGDWITVVLSGYSEEPVVRSLRFRPGAERAPHVVSDEGDAAIAPDGRVVLALASGRVLVLGEQRGPEGAPRVHADVPIELEPYAVACDADGILLLAGTRVGDADDGERIAAASSWTPKRAWTCTLVELGFDGRERSRTEVPFAGLQALRRRDGSVVVAGMGVALVDDGKVRWARASTDRVHAASVGDGIVLAHGTTIERVDAVGRVVATATIEGGPITCLGPIGGDGAIWVATAKGVWRSG